MDTTLYNIFHDGDLLANGLTAEQAVLFCARWDGWGAEFARDYWDRMGLRRSPRHIGNNSWHASSDDKPLFGVTSSLLSDAAAISEVSERLVVLIHQLFNLMDVIPVKATVISNTLDDESAAVPSLAFAARFALSKIAELRMHPDVDFTSRAYSGVARAHALLTDALRGEK